MPLEERLKQAAANLQNNTNGSALPEKVPAAVRLTTASQSPNSTYNIAANNKPSQYLQPSGPGHQYAPKPSMPGTTMTPMPNTTQPSLSPRPATGNGTRLLGTPRGTSQVPYKDTPRPKTQANLPEESFAIKAAVPASPGRFTAPPASSPPATSNGRPLTAGRVITATPRPHSSHVTVVNVDSNGAGQQVQGKGADYFEALEGKIKAGAFMANGPLPRVEGLVTAQNDSTDTTKKQNIHEQKAGIKAQLQKALALTLHNFGNGSAILRYTTTTFLICLS